MVNPIKPISMELFVGICIIPFLSALFIQAGQNDDSDDHDFLELIHTQGLSLSPTKSHLSLDSLFRRDPFIAS